MWLLFGIVFGLGIGLLAITNPQVQNAKAAQFGEFSFPRSGYGDPLPLLFGTFRQDSPVTLWYGGYRTQAITQKVKTGLFSSKNQTIGYKYYFTFDLLLALGPGVRLKKIWVNSNKLVWEGDIGTQQDIVIDKPSLFGGDKQQGGIGGTATFYPGDNSTLQDSTLVSYLGANVPSYNGMARLVFKDFYIGNTTNPPTFSFEIERIPDGVFGSAVRTDMPNGLDMNPVGAALDLLTLDWGGFGTPVTSFDQAAMAADANTVYSEAQNGHDQGFSQILQSNASAEDIISEILEHIDAIMYEDISSGLIRTKLLRNDYDLETILTLDTRDIVEVRDLSKTTWSETINQTRLSFRDREQEYNTAVAVAQDFGNINWQGRIRSSENTMRSVTSSEGANWIVSRDLSYSNIPLFSCEVEASRKASGLRPGDVVRINYTAGFTMNDLIFRVVKVDLGTTNDPSVKLKLLQDRFATNFGSFAPPTGSEFVQPDTSPKPITSYVIAGNVPYFLATSGEDPAAFETTAKYGIAATIPSDTSGGFDVLMTPVSGDFDDAEQIGDNLAYQPTGTLRNDYLVTVAQNTRRDTGQTLIVDGLDSREIALLKNYSSFSQAQDASSMFFMNDEIFIYVGYTLRGDGGVEFDVVHRGALDSIPETHSAGSTVFFFNGSSSITTGVDAGTTRYIKILDNAVGGSYPEASAVQIAVTSDFRAAKPLLPAYFRVNGVRNPTSITGTTMTFSWYNRSRLDTSLREYDSSFSQLEPTCAVRIRWRRNGAAWNTITSTGTSETVTGGFTNGTIEVEVTGLNQTTGRLSDKTETYTFTHA